METNDEFQERLQRQQRLTARLRLATARLEEAQQERTWAVVESHASGVSIRAIPAAPGLPAARRGGGQARRRGGPARPAPARVGGARSAAETTDGAGGEGCPPRLAESSAVQERLNEPGPGPLIGTIRITSPDCVVWGG